MKLPVIIASYNRPQLLKQTLETLIKNSDNPLDIIVIDDCSTNDTWSVVDKIDYPDISWSRLTQTKPIGFVRNEGVRLIASDSEYIYFSDDDVYFLPHWDSLMIKVMEAFTKIKVLGGRRHPHHKILDKIHTVDLLGIHTIVRLENQAGYSLFLRKKDFDEVGHFQEYSLDTRGLEDSQLVEYFREKDGIIAAFEPPILYHCGIQGTNGLPAADYHDLLNLKHEHPEILVL